MAVKVDEAQALPALVVGASLPLSVNFPFTRSYVAARLMQRLCAGSLGRLPRAYFTVYFVRWPQQ